jgi:hypothetical protein
MKSRHPISRLLTADRKIAVILALPIFVVVVWYGIAHHFEDMDIYAVAMALASWGLARWAVFTLRKWQQWRMKSRGGRGA